MAPGWSIFLDMTTKQIQALEILRQRAPRGTSAARLSTMIDGPGAATTRSWARVLDSMERAGLATGIRDGFTGSTVWLPKETP